MISFVLRRSAYGLGVMLVVTSTVFLVTRVLTDPARVRLGLHATPEQYENLRRVLGLDRPILEQFVEFLVSLVRFDFGTSFVSRAPALDLVVDRLPATFELAFAGMALAIVVFIPLGVVAAIRPGGLLDRITVSASLLGVSMPQFWLGAMLILLFSVVLGWFPTSGRGTVSHLFLPALTLALTSGGRLAHITRSSMIDQLSKPYVASLKARGFGTFRILFGHVLRNALVPILTLAMYEMTVTLAGYTVVVETVFGWPGIGSLAIHSVTQRDSILLQAIVFVVAFIIVVANFLADLIYKLVDPRIKLD